MTLVALVLVAALNPLVVRSPEPHGNVPANCEVSDAPAAPRAAPVTVAEVDDPGVPLPPVRPATRTQGQQTRYDVRALQQAIAANNRAQFDAELARARDAGVPTRVYEDVGRLWDAQFESPFFAEGSEPHRIASQYPGYEAAVREQIFTDAGGKKFYPASESKAFVARQTGVNLPAATRSRTTTTTSTTSATQQPGNRVTQQPGNRVPPQPSARPTTRTPPPTPRPSASRPTNRSQTAVARKESPPRRSPDPSAAQKPAATVPAPVVPPVENTSSTTAPPAAGSLPVDPIAITTTDDPLVTDTTASDTTATDTMVTDTATTATDTVATDTTATTTTGTAAQPGRSIILPAILILIGLGVLILLFKAR